MGALKLSLAALLLSGCASPKYAKRELESRGFTNVQITGYVRKACTEDDDIRAGFTAETEGHRWRGVLCKNVFDKSSTTVTFQEITK